MKRTAISRSGANRTFPLYFFPVILKREAMTSLRYIQNDKLLPASLNITYNMKTETL